jgi:hypothetical protein
MRVIRGLLITSLFSTLAACTDNGPADPGPEDMDEDPVIPVLPYRYYVIDHLTVPTSTAEANQAGLDLDANGTVDNKLGGVIATLATMGVDAAATVTQSIDRGDSILLARIGTTSFADAAQATFQTFAGADPSIAPCNGDTDTECRHHLQGTASFSAMPDPGGKPLLGTFGGGTFYGSGGELVVRLAVLGADPIDLVLMGSKAQIQMATDTTIGKAQLAGAVSQDDIDNKILPAVHENMTAAVAHDCTALTSPPACGCATSSDGKSALATFDKDPVDCQISFTEIADNVLVKAMMKPDVTIDGKMGVSLGVTATAVMAQFSAPQ